MDKSNKKELQNITVVESPSQQEYYSTPINEQSTQIARSDKYTTIVENNKKTTSRAIENLFTEDIFDYFTSFEITSEESLSKFWEFYLLDRDIELGEISNVLKTVFTLGEIQLQKNKTSRIIVEESATKQFVTISNLNIPVDTIKMFIQKNNFEGNYKIAYGKVSFEVNLLLPEKQVVKSEIQNAFVMQSKQSGYGEFTSRELQEQTSQKLVIYEDIDKEDLSDIEEDTRNVHALFKTIDTNDISKENMAHISYYLANISTTLSTYNEFYPIAQVLSEFSHTIKTYCNNFIRNAKTLIPMCKILIYHINTWINKLFYLGAPSIDFMHENIIRNTQTLCDMTRED